MSMAQWPTFSRMRGDSGREWYRLSDLVNASAEAGRRLTIGQVRSAIRLLPKPAVKRYGHYHYTAEHREAVQAAVRRLMS
jgi:hypothetical protein